MPALGSSPALTKRRFMAEIVPVDPLSPDAAAVRRAADILRAGGLVAFPTETVYGLGADALNPRAVQGIFNAKGRPQNNPLIVHAAEAAAAKRITLGWSPAADALAAAFWPGPLTMVLRAAGGVPGAVTAGLETVAVRVPAHPTALALLRASGLVLAAPSANRSNQVSPTTAAHVQSSLGDRINLILDAGPTGVGIESTVLDLTTEPPRILRPGPVTAAQIRQVIGAVADPPSDAAPAPERPASPGMLARHYAPAAKVVLFDASTRPVIEAEAARAAARGERVGALLMTEFAAPLHVRVDMPVSPAGYAQRLYAALHEADAAGCATLYVERVPENNGWAAIRDRLNRASS